MYYLVFLFVVILLCEFIVNNKKNIFIMKIKDFKVKRKRIVYVFFGLIRKIKKFIYIKKWGCFFFIYLFWGERSIGDEEECIMVIFCFYVVGDSL